jgi:hypothetical protein
MDVAVAFIMSKHSTHPSLPAVGMQEKQQDPFGLLGSLSHQQ